MEISDNKSEGRKNIEGNFNKEFYMGREELSDFLKNLADEIEQGNELEIKTDEWVLPFKFRDNVEVEIDKDYEELEIELEFEEFEKKENVTVG
ncbi:MAG: amphi-Trp domain-containing protein [Candidatus Aenigmatarchaeota archaeon]